MKIIPVTIKRPIMQSQSLAERLMVPMLEQDDSEQLKAVLSKLETEAGTLLHTCPDFVLTTVSGTYKLRLLHRFATRGNFLAYVENLKSARDKLGEGLNSEDSAMLPERYDAWIDLANCVLFTFDRPFAEAVFKQYSAESECK